MKCIHNTAGVCDWTLQPCRSPACNEDVSEMKRINIKIRDGISEMEAILLIADEPALLCYMCINPGYKECPWCGYYFCEEHFDYKTNHCLVCWERDIVN